MDGVPKATPDLSLAEVEAECELANVMPTSIEGVIALLDYGATVEKELGGFREVFLDPEEPNERLGRSWYYFSTATWQRL